MNEDKQQTVQETGDERFAEQAKALFDESVDSIDAARLSQLNQARHRALEELERGRAVIPWQRVLPAGGAAAAVALAVLLVIGPDEDGIEIPPATAETDFELLMNEDSLEMLEELEFYSWLSLEKLEGTDESELEG